jgi:hypoxanthine phosphoribosyltransferase
MNKERDKVFSEMESKYGIDMKGKTPIGDLPSIMSKADWLLVSCFLKYPNGVPKDKGERKIVSTMILVEWSDSPKMETLFHKMPNDLQQSFDEWLSDIEEEVKS